MVGEDAEVSDLMLARWRDESDESREEAMRFEVDVRRARAGALVGECCEAHGTAGCEDDDDDDTTECVCAIEPNCCDPQDGWTNLCTGLAASHCGAPCPALPPGNCCEPHAELSCDEPELAACACEIHFQCCAYPEYSWPWEDYCVGLVAEHCNAECC